MAGTRKRIVSLLMAVVMLIAFSVTALAAANTEGKGITPYAGRIFISGVSVDAVNSQGISTQLADSSWPGSGTYSAKSYIPRSIYNNAISLGYYKMSVSVTYNIQKDQVAPRTIALYVNDQLIRSSAALPGTDTTTFETSLSTSTDFRLTLDGTGATAWGNIGIQ